jgi:hypothetical protein
VHGKIVIKVHVVGWPSPEKKVNIVQKIVPIKMQEIDTKNVNRRPRE